MSIDTTAPLFTATAEHLVETVLQARAEATIQRLRADALERELQKSSDEERRALAASAYWKLRCEQAEAELHDLRGQPTEPLPRVLAVPEPPARTRRRGRGKHQ